MQCFTVLGPAQSGKSTLVAALAGLEGFAAATETLGCLSLTRFTFLNESWCAFDVQGGPEYLGHAGQALAASDAAIVVVPADADAAVLAAPYLRLADASGTPAMLFVNKIDAAQGRMRDMVEALQAYTAHAIVLRQIPIREGGEVTGAVDLISERAWEYEEGKPSHLIEMPATAAVREQEARTELLEHLADFDDALLEQLIEDRKPSTDAIYAIATKVLEDNAVMPAFLGAASHSNGVMRLMKALRHDAPDTAATRARLGAGTEAVGVFASIRKHMGKATVLRAFGDGVKAGSALGGQSLGSLAGIDGKARPDALAPGEVGVAVKSDHLTAGMLYTALQATPLGDWARGPKPALLRTILPANDRDDARLSAALAKLAETDPGMDLRQDSVTGHAQVALQGPMHLRRLLTSLSAEFGIEASEAEVRPEYRETITKPVKTHYRHRKQSGGAGQFADVHLSVRPEPRGAGFTFSESVKGGAVPRNYIPAVEVGARDALAEGPLGVAVIDLSVELTDGKHHAVDSSDFAFRMAGRMGVREALADARPVLLQPIHGVAIHVPSVFSGGLVTLVSSLKGQVLGFDTEPGAAGWDIFRALLPAASLDELVRALGGATQGTAWFEADFDHYEEVHGKAAETIIAKGEEPVG